MKAFSKPPRIGDPLNGKSEFACIVRKPKATIAIHAIKQSIAVVSVGLRDVAVPVFASPTL